MVEIYVVKIITFVAGHVTVIFIEKIEKETLITCRRNVNISIDLCGRETYRDSPNKYNAPDTYNYIQLYTTCTKLIKIHIE